MPEIPEDISDESRKYIESDPIRKAFFDEIPSWLETPEEEEIPEFQSLRREAHERVRRDMSERLAQNPEPDEEEIAAGAYREMIEPQCREAVFKMRRKGHSTYSSGFGTGNKQILDGLLSTIGIETARELKQKGYILYRTGLVDPSVAFRPARPDLEEMKATWDQLAELVPDLGHPAEPVVESRKEFDEMVRRSGF